jgi:uncharacterized protein YndB with AHSA1/START domain
MNASNIHHTTLVFERSFATSPAEVFAAWTSRDALLDWSAPGEGWDMTYRAFDFRVGHTDICAFGLSGEEPYINTVQYHAIRLDQYFVYASTISHRDVLLFAGTVSVVFSVADGGTTLTLTEAGVYFDGDSPEGHQEGWDAMLNGLTAYLDGNRRAA